MNLREVWRFQHTGGPNYDYSTPPLLFVTNGKVTITYHDENNYHTSWLTALSLETGQMMWQTYLADPGFGTGMADARLENERLYLVYSYRAHAFDLETGQLLWSTTLSPGGHTTYRFFAPWEWEDEEPLLLLRAFERDKIVTIDPQTGEVLAWQPDERADLEWEGVEFLVDMAGLYVGEPATGRVLWTRLEMDAGYRQLQRWPTFVGSNMVYELGDPCYGIRRVNYRTGEAVWETPERNYLSNFAIAGSQVYVLREDTTLVTLDLESGALVGTLKFDGPPADTICAKSGTYPYWVVVSEPYILVYFGDTRELIALAP
jgi:outer membrane protein assembly factor BamB